MMRRFVNLVTLSDAQHVYSVRRMDPYKQLFYPSAKAAIEAAADEATMKESFPALQTLQLPRPIMNFTAKDSRGLADCEGSLDMFALFSPRGTSEGRIVYANTNGEAGLYDADRHVHNTLGVLSQRKGVSPVCLSIAHHGSKEDSMYVLDSHPRKDDGPGCFEVLEFAPSRRGLSSLASATWRWRLLPPPPFVGQPGYRSSFVTAYTTVVDSDGCSAIYLSCNPGIGTYRFETARHDPSCRDGWSPSEEWSYVGAWPLPFGGRAQYVPEFNLWFGFSGSFPNHLCAADLSAMDRQRPPTVLQDWEDLNPPDGHVWYPMSSNLVNLGKGKFLIAKAFESGATGAYFAVLTGIEMTKAGVGDHQSLEMVKHKCAQFMFGDDSIECVL